jgi:hypothetical protein
MRRLPGPRPTPAFDGPECVAALPGQIGGYGTITNPCDEPSSVAQSHQLCNHVLIQHKEGADGKNAGRENSRCG